MKKYLSTISARVSFLILLLLLILIPPIGSMVSAQFFPTSVIGNSPVWQATDNLSVFVGQGLITKVEARDPNGDPLTYFATQLPANASFDTATQVLTFNPSLFQTGTQSVVLSVTDFKTPPVENRIFISVIDNNARNRSLGGFIDSASSNKQNFPPVFAPFVKNQSILSGNTLQFALLATDSDPGDYVTITASGLPSGARFDNRANIFSWTPSVTQVGTYPVLFRAGDGHGSGSAIEIVITVEAPAFGATFSNNVSSPLFTSRPATTLASASLIYEYQARAFDQDNDAIFYRIVRGPVGAIINQGTGMLRWIPATSQIGKSHDFVIAVSDGKGGETTQSFAVFVNSNGLIGLNQGVGSNSVVVPPEVAPIEPEVRIVRVPASQSPTLVSAQNRSAQDFSVTAVRSFAPLPNLTPVEAFGISVQSSSEGEVIVRWLTNQPADGEIVFGTASYSKNSAHIWNYDFTSGQTPENTWHEVNLGKLQQKQTYYMRIVSRAGSQMDVTSEIAFIPFATLETPVVAVSDNQTELNPSAAASVSSVGDGFFVGEYFVLILMIFTVFLLLYLVFRKPVVTVPAFSATNLDQ